MNFLDSCKSVECSSSWDNDSFLCFEGKRKLIFKESKLNRDTCQCEEKNFEILCDCGILLISSILYR